MGCSSSQPEAPRQPTTPQHKYTNDLARARWRRAIRLVIASNNFKKAGFERRLRAGQEADLSDPTKEKPQRQSSRLEMKEKAKERRLSEAKAEDARLEQVRLDDLGAKIDAIAGACGASVERLHGVLVLDEIAKMTIFLIANRGLEADRLLSDFQNY